LNKIILHKALYLVSFILFACSVKAQYLGGNDDGFSSAATCSSTLNGVTTTLTTSGITGPASFCSNATETYSLTVTAGYARASYWYNLPAGSAVAGGQNTTTALISFGNTSGSITVNVYNECTNLTIGPSAVTAVNCTNYLGGNNDGFTAAAACSSTLNGVVTSLTAGAISGPLSFCRNNTETYSVAVTSGNANSSYWYNLPAGSSVIGGQGTNTALVSLGAASGSITVDLTNECGTVTVGPTALTAVNCVNYSGGNNDGFNAQATCTSTLNGVVIPLTAGPITGPTSFCSNSTETYAVTVASGSATSSYWYNLPAGGSVVGGQGTNTTLVSLGAASGGITVDLTNECGTVTVGPLALTAIACGNYLGGNNDGFSSAPTCASTLNGVTTALTIGALTPTLFCNNTTETFTVPVTTGYASYSNWTTLPAGASLVSQTNNSGLISLAAASGNITVTLYNECGSVTSGPTAVTATACGNYLGGNNDGFTSAPVCNTTLNGVSTPITASFSGNTNVCNNTIETATLTVSSGIVNYYSWNALPAGANFLTNTNTISNILWGSTSGSVQVTLSNECQTIIPALAVTTNNCGLHLGGKNDGFAGLKTSTNKPLPIMLLSFTAKPVNNKVQLQWITESETNNDFFTIDKTIDGFDFSFLTKQKGAGFSTVKLTYNAIDDNPFEGTSFYRLKQTDFDGKFTYSNLVPVTFNFTTEPAINAYPNPARSNKELNVDLSDFKTGQSILLILLDIYGNEIYSKVVVTSDRITHLSGISENQDLPAGIYFITGTVDNKIYKQKIVIQ